MPQITLANAVSCTGISLHSGRDVSMEFRPAPENTGIVFHAYTDDKVHVLAPRPEAVSTTELATTISGDGISVSTIEHVLAALSGLCIDNVEVHVHGGEVPILDGSALVVVDALRHAGMCFQHAARRVFRIVRSISVEQDGKSIVAEPYDGFHVDYTIRFPHPVIGEQRLSLDITPSSFVREIARARTFGFLKQVEYLRSRGLTRGGSLENAVVIGDEGVLNKEGLRFPDEFVRHKILDFMGDMAMLGRPLLGSFTVRCSGHGFNNFFLRHLSEKAGTLELSEV